MKFRDTKMSEENLPNRRKLHDKITALSGDIKHFRSREGEKEGVPQPLYTCEGLQAKKIAATVQFYSWKHVWLIFDYFFLKKCHW